MRVYFANDCRAYHGGSWAVSEVIRSEVEARGHGLLVEGDTRRIEADAIRDSDAVIVNGEGTLHGNNPRAMHLLTILQEAQRLGKPTALVNTSWSQMSGEFDDVLRRLDQLVARELISAQELAAKHGVTPEICLDLSLQHPARPAACERATPVLATDFYSREFGAFALLTGGAMAGVPALQMRLLTWQQTLQAIAGCQVFLTGRFHGALAALRTRTPFVAYSGNTHKVRGLLRWADAEDLVCDDFRGILAAAREWPRKQDQYERLFQWAETRQVWHFPF